MTQEAQPWRWGKRAEKTLNQLLITAENAETTVKNHLRTIISLSFFRKPHEDPVVDLTTGLIKGSFKIIQLFLDSAAIFA